MSRAFVFPAVLLFCAASVGCNTVPERPGFFLEPPKTIEVPELGVHPPEIFASTEPPAEGGRFIQLDARFVSTSQDVLGRLSLSAERRASLVDSGDVDELLKVSRGTRVLSSPRVTLQSGARAWVSVITDRAFVHDLQLERTPQWPYAARVLVGKFHEGVILDVTARVEDTSVEIERIVPQVASLLGTRHCTGRFVLNDVPFDFQWGEPVVLRADLAAEAIDTRRLDHGQALVLLLEHSIEQATSPARALAVNETVSERYVAYDASDRLEGPPAFLVVLTARTGTLSTTGKSRESRENSPSWKLARGERSEEATPSNR